MTATELAVGADQTGDDAAGADAASADAAGADAAAELLGSAGPLAKHIDGFAPRAQQQRMATAVATALAEAGVLVVEAGTGTGKTFAYLVPALLAGQKVIISTGTRNLQDQLFFKDLPLVRKALGRPLDAALLKGRSNYLCRYRLGLALSEGRLSRRQQTDLVRVRAWAGHTHSGDIGEVGDVAEDSPLWPAVTSTVDNCLGADCPDYGECFLVKARRRALEADLLVINHHLFCADMAIKEEGFGEVLPGADAFILDEAHQLPEVASRFFGLGVSSRQLFDLARDSEVEQLRDAPDFAQLMGFARALERAVNELRLALGSEPRREPWPRLAKRPAVIAAIAELDQALTRLGEALTEAAVRGKGLESCKARCELLLGRFRQFSSAREDIDQGADPEDEPGQAGESSPDNVHWVEIRSHSFSLNLTPLAIGRFFRSRMRQYQSSWVFTSATLAVNQNFDHFNNRLGLENPATLLLASPFDYARNALLYHPKDLPDPATPGYNQAVLEASLPVLEASAGRAFVLFTSHQALRHAADWLAERLDFPLLVQGALPKAVLLERFRAYGNAVLLGTSSFWEGVDVRGGALSCVIIAKLPFASPGDPVLQARIDALRRQGSNPFMDYQLPQAVIALNQGVGRLIRDVNDRGVLTLCDPRLLSKPYGRLFLRSLPPMRRSRSLRQVRDFFAGRVAEPGAEYAPAEAAFDC